MGLEDSSSRSEAAARYDGYYAIIMNNLFLSTVESDLRAHPVSRKMSISKGIRNVFPLLVHLKIHKIPLFDRTEQNRQASVAEIMEEIRKPLGLVQGEFP
jgi:hypothetical protein